MWGTGGRGQEEGLRSLHLSSWRAGLRAAECVENRKEGPPSGVAWGWVPAGLSRTPAPAPSSHIHPSPGFSDNQDIGAAQSGQMGNSPLCGGSAGVSLFQPSGKTGCRCAVQGPASPGWGPPLWFPYREDLGVETRQTETRVCVCVCVWFQDQEGP